MTETETLAFYRDAYTKTLARAEALEASNTRLYEQSAQHTEAYGIVCAERDAALHRLSEETRKRELYEVRYTQILRERDADRETIKSRDVMLEAARQIALRRGEYAVTCSKALERIASRKPYASSGGVACPSCGTYWHPDTAVIKWQEEHHHDTCAYLIASTALSKNSMIQPDGSYAITVAPDGTVTDMNAKSLPGVSHPLPEGWKLVPIEPTQRMTCEAFIRATTVAPDGWSLGTRDSQELFAAIYKTMLGIAPEPSAVPSQGNPV